DDAGVPDHRVEDARRSDRIAKCPRAVPAECRFLAIPGVENVANIPFVDRDRDWRIATDLLASYFYHAGHRAEPFIQIDRHGYDGVIVVQAIQGMAVEMKSEEVDQVPGAGENFQIPRRITGCFRT